MLNNFLIVLGVVFGLPILAYMVMKFGTTGYLRAKGKDNKKQKDEQA